MEEVFIVYIDEKNQEFSGFVQLKQKTDTYITFLTNKDNEITIPVGRLIKIKKKVTPNDE